MWALTHTSIHTQDDFKLKTNSEAINTLSWPARHMIMKSDKKIWCWETKTTKKIEEKIVRDRQKNSGTCMYDQGGLRAGVPTSNDKFKQLSVFYGHTKAFYRCSGVFDARWSMPPISWEELKIDFKSDKISRIFHILFDQTKLFHTL